MNQQFIIKLILSHIYSISRIESAQTFSPYISSKDTVPVDNTATTSENVSKYFQFNIAEVHKMSKQYKNVYTRSYFSSDYNHNSTLISIC